jgi:hypothetical protein
MTEGQPERHTLQAHRVSVVQISRWVRFDAAATIAILQGGMNEPNAANIRAS